MSINSLSNSNKIIAVCGPTASGKTALSIEIAKKFNGEIVSCDSMQIYKGMDIGTAKPDENERQGIVHHMIDVVNPDEKYNVVSFKKDAEIAIDDILKRNKLPVLVGGTGLYMDSVLNNVGFSEAETDSVVRERLTKLWEEKGSEYIHLMLSEIDPESAEKIHPNNVRRVVRALEIYETTGKTMTQANEESKQNAKYDSLILGLMWEREELYERINKRVDIMIESGLEAEVKKLINSGIDKSQTSMQAIGYKEFIEYFDGNISLNDAVEKIKQESRRYAKRQMTWLKRNEKINWLLLQNDYNFTKICEQCFTMTEKFVIMNCD